MNIRPYKNKHPSIDPSAHVDEQAAVIGDVVIGAESSVWPMAVVRGDVNYIRIGARTNIQDGSVLHVTHDHPAAPGGHPLIIGDEVTVGHNVTLHGCTIAERCLIGMGAVILDGARLEPYTLVGAGSLVPPGKVLEGGYLWLGSPVRRARALSTEEREAFAYSARHYIALKESYRTA
jgi:carbonic anhydrase/acetyltransferase-like protein (isoleucine patch superfamily)